MDKEEFKEKFDKVLESSPELKKDFEETKKFMKMISPYLNMTKEEMEKAIPEGAYNISSGRWRAMTGKAGLIQVILKVKEEFNTNKN